MNNELIVCIALAIMLAFSTYMAGKFWKEKEYYRCRVFDLTNGKEGSNLPKGSDMPAPPAPPKIFMPTPTIPLDEVWLHNNRGEYFRRKDVVALIQNPTGTMKVALSSGHTIDTGLDIKDLTKVLGISFSCSVNEELEHRKEMNKKEG
jgi:hypothetical protein